MRHFNTGELLYVINLSSPSQRVARGFRGRVGTLVGTAVVGAMCVLSGTAQAQSAVGPVSTPGDGSLTYKGITLYGIVDAGFQYMQHGAPGSDYFQGTSSDIVQKFSNHSETGVTSNNLSQSRIGLFGIEPLGVGDLTGIFRVETFFNPSSGDISDAVKSVTLNNGKTNAANCASTPPGCQSTNLDSSLAGELFEQAYVGVSSATYGSLTFGRQNTLLADGVAKYDPNQASYAFSIIGLSGTTAGGGDTQNRRFDSSVKYLEAVGPAHFGVQYKFGQSYGGANTAIQADLGGEYAGLSVDAYYSYIRDAVSAAPLTGAQLATAVAAPYYLSSSNSVAGTISDNTSVAVMALYAVPAIPLKIFGGYEYIWYKDPRNPLAIGADDIGGYKLGAVNNTAYLAHDKILQVYWLGAKYTVRKQLDLTAAYYGYHQNAYATGALAGCDGTQNGACAGRTAAASLDADYRWTKRFDTYAGLMYTKVYGGQANGYLFATDTINPTIGFRFRF
jgi:predicted porin